jgi:hypothetical protein
VSFKTCPSCNAEVPDVANLCKHCFHDFSVVVRKPKSALWPVLLLAFGSAIVSAAAFGYMHSANRTVRAAIDGETQRIVFATTTSSGAKAEQVLFKDIASVNYFKDGKPRPYEVAAVGTNGERYTLRQADDPIEGEARIWAAALEKPLIGVEEVAPTVIP